jgi:integrative and conjugative element protein (TIGR02256 family)
MEQETRAWYPRETGGVLMGYRLEDHLNVSRIIGAGPLARHLAGAFEPDWKWQQEEVASQYKASGRMLEYIGDWHSHPRGVPRPSAKDRGTARTIAISTEARCPAPLMIIVGLRRREERPEMCAYIYTDSKLITCKMLPGGRDPAG